MVSRFILVVVALLSISSSVFSKNMGAITVDVDGTPKTVYVVGPDWSAGNVKVEGNGFTLRGGGRIYLAAKATDDFNDPNMYWQVHLNDKHFSYDEDLSNVGCKCNAASYFSQMPAYNAGQQPDKGPGGDWYCDANNVNGFWCPEYDTNEANKFNMASTLHTCNYVPPHFFSTCDKGGCQTHIYFAKSNGFCPRDDCTINTKKPFTVSHTQNASFVNNWYSQEGRTMSFNVCNKDWYVKNMSYSLNGMVFVASLWGGNGINMDWLDGMTGCQGPCNIGGTSVRYSNFSLRSLSKTNLK